MLLSVIKKYTEFELKEMKQKETNTSKDERYLTLRWIISLTTMQSKYMEDFIKIKKQIIFVHIRKKDIEYILTDKRERLDVDDRNSQDDV